MPFFWEWVTATVFQLKGNDKQTAEEQFTQFQVKVLLTVSYV